MDASSFLLDVGDSAGAPQVLKTFQKIPCK